MKTLSVEEFRTHMADYLATPTSEEVILTLDGRPCALVRPIHPPMDEESEALAKSDEFWEMIEARRQEAAIPWEDVKQELGLR